MNDNEIDNIIRKALASERELPAGLSNRLEQRIDQLASEKEKKKIFPTRRRSIYWLGGIAASLLLGIVFFTQTGRPGVNPAREDTFTDPRQAAIIAQEALALLSTQLNKGLEPVADARKEVDRINALLTKQFEAINEQK